MKVFISMPVRDGIPAETMMSVVGAIERLHQLRIPWAMECQASATLCGARNEGVASFLKSDCDCYLMVDSDIVFLPETVSRMLSLAESDDVDVLAAPYPQRKDEEFQLLVATTNFTPDPRGLLPLTAAGLGLTLVKRKVFEKLVELFPLRRYHPKDDPVAEVFRWGWNGEHFRGEDRQFFEDVRENGFKCWCDARSVLGHMGKKMYVMTPPETKAAA